MVQLNSLSSSLMLGINSYRNQAGIAKKVVAEPIYATIIVIAAVETAAAYVFTLLSVLAYPLSSRPLASSLTLLSSSSFVIIWSLGCVALNLSPEALPGEEIKARRDMHIVFDGLYDAWSR